MARASESITVLVEMPHRKRAPNREEFLQSLVFFRSNHCGEIRNSEAQCVQQIRKRPAYRCRLIAQPGRDCFWIEGIKIHQKFVRVPRFDIPFGQRRRREIFEVRSHDNLSVGPHGHGGYVAVFRIVRHKSREFLVALDPSFREVELDLFRQMRDFSRTQFSAALQVPCYFSPDPIRPLRNVEVWCFREAQQRIAQGSR